MEAHSFAELFGHAFDVVGVDAAGFVFVEEVEDLVDAVLHNIMLTRDSLSPNLEVMASKNS